MSTLDRDPPRYQSRNSIEDVWGQRKAYKQEWPTRVDYSWDVEPETWVQSACVLCSNGCGLDIGVKHGKVVGVRGREDDGVNKGRLGPKGLHGWKAINSPDRLTHPLVRENGVLRKASWEEAMKLIVSRAIDPSANPTNHSIAFYTSGQLFLEEYYALALIGKAGLNTLHMYGSYADIDCTDCLFMVGHNVAATQTVLWSRILDRLDGPDPPKLIVVDPRLTETARRATIHLTPRINHQFVSRHVVGLDEVRAKVKDYTPARVASITGVPVEDLQQAARIIGFTKSLLSTALQGVYQSNQATASACQINNINLVRGFIGKPGSSVLQMNGQPTAQNNRETGCDGEFPGLRNHQNPAHMDELARLLPDLPRIRKLFTDPELFVVCQDIFLTETAAVADVVLPAAQWGEKTGTFTNADRTVHISHQAVAPPGEARSDLEIFLDFGRRMGFQDKDGKSLFPWTHPEEVFEAWKRISAGRPCDYSGLTYAKLSGASGIRWPCNNKHPCGTERLYSDGVFLTDIDTCESFGHDMETGAPLSKDEYMTLNPAGRAILKSSHYFPSLEEANEDYPLTLATGRKVHHFHTRTKTGRTALQNACPEPYIRVSEADASRLNISDNEVVVARSRRGAVEMPVRVGGIKDGQVFIPFHFGYWDSKDGRSRAANELTIAQWDAISKQPTFKAGAIRIEKLPEGTGPFAREEQSAALKRAASKEAASEATPADLTDRERALELWLGETYAALPTIQSAIQFHPIQASNSIQFGLPARQGNSIRGSLGIG
ncbi:formate dehydrogenase subunit alpha [Diaporthe sp. PMI_573]|nr:formate dehydrogenase subunit alpha [Diaporthaceae sp. PMI_573]